MLIALRLVALIGLGAVAFCAIAWLVSRRPVWLRRALLALKATIAVALLFFAVVIVERL